MGGLLAVLGKRLAEQWLTLLALPGALYVAAALAAHTLGVDHMWDWGHLVTRITAWARDPRIDTLAGQVVVFVAVVAIAAVVGLAAQALGGVVERLWFAAGWASWLWFAPRLVGAVVRRRRLRWSGLRAAAARARSEHGGAGPVGAVPFEVAYDRMARVGVEDPRRPTWCGDRLNAVAVRFGRDHDLDFAVVWPHLWLVLPEEVRAQVTVAREDLGRATGLVAWALLYLLLVVWWPPIALVCAALAAVGWWRVRAATETYATLLEAATRTHVGELAERVGVEYGGLLTRQIGQDLSLRLRPTFPPDPGGTAGDRS